MCPNEGTSFSCTVWVENVFCTTTSPLWHTICRHFLSFDYLFCSVFQYGFSNYVVVLTCEYVNFAFEQKIDLILVLFSTANSLPSFALTTVCTEWSRYRVTSSLAAERHSPRISRMLERQNIHIDCMRRPFKMKVFWPSVLASISQFRWLARAMLV